MNLARNATTICASSRNSTRTLSKHALLCLKDALLDNVNGGNTTDVHHNLHRHLYCKLISINGIATNCHIKLPTWIKKGIITLYPRKVYMGFKRSYNNVNNKSININREKIKGKKWVRTGEGSYKVEVGDSKKTEGITKETS